MVKVRAFNNESGKSGYKRSQEFSSGAKMFGFRWRRTKVYAYPESTFFLPEYFSNRSEMLVAVSSLVPNSFSKASIKGLVA